MALALAMGSFGLFLLAMAILLLNGQRRNRDELGQLDREVDQVVDTLRTPEEKAGRERRRREIEQAKQNAFDLHDDGT